jgi:segregation and condensation protein B
MTETVAETPAEAAPSRPRETDPEKIVPALEALLFSSARPVTKRDLADVLDATPDAVAGALARLTRDADSERRGIRLEEVAGGWRFVTRPEFDALLRRFHNVSERSRLSLAALETLAIIAYRQPITLPEIQEIRGVNSASVVNTLFEKKLITTAGRKSVVGSPFLYRTTPEFLVRFGLKDVEDLPRPEELAEDLAATVGETPAEPASAAAAVASDADDEGDADDDEDADDASGETEPGGDASSR